LEGVHALAQVCFGLLAFYIRDYDDLANVQAIIEVLG
jgi:hypothetical protein